MASAYPIPRPFWLFVSPLRLFLVAGVIIALPFIVFTWLAEQQTRETVWAEAKARNETMANLAQKVVRNAFRGMAEYVTLLSTHDGIARAIQSGDREFVQSHLKTFVEHSAQFHRVIITSPDGSLLFDYPVDPSVKGLNYAYRDWYRGVRRSGQFYVSQIYRRAEAGQPYVVAATMPIRDEQGAIVAYLVGQLELGTLTDWINQLNPNRHTHLLLADSSGQAAGVGNKTPEDWRGHAQLKHALESSKAGRSGMVETNDPVSGKPALVTYAPVPPYGWTVVISQEKSEILAPLQILHQTLLWLAIAMLLVLAPLGYLCLSAVLRQQRAAEASQNLLACILDSCHDPVVAFDMQTRLLAANGAWMDAIASAEGHTPRLGEVLPSDPGGDTDELRARILATGVMDELVEFHEGPLKSRSFEVKSSRLLDGRGKQKGVVVCAHEVSDWLAAQRKITLLNLQTQEHNEALKAANKELESFSYSVSHDLRAPLRAIDGFSGMLARRSADRLDEEDKRMLGIVRDNSKMMGRLIDNLLEFSRLGRQQMSRGMVDMQLLVEEAWHSLRDDFHGELCLGKLPSAPADRALLKQVWINLLSNAIKYSGGVASPRIEVDGWQGNGEYCYRVRDNGAGFDMRYVGKLFGVFQRLHASDEFPGSGVGLAIIARIITRHGGKVSAEGEVGVGASFQFSLPMQADASAATVSNHGEQYGNVASH
ncbi:hypothetical protein FNU76_00750 [Chitinimonas arctica]|uniref:histidine kinase n=1 Tax=Chitinimonas arctica TaxID=2594795 RepID=A0A516SA19_9NEIS|nr:cache domain-containing protein [Chitinimonas arctica]QDQ24992.1 hypothetical protein FNU76_00750 [Chitinimonas arctica]